MSKQPPKKKNEQQFIDTCLKRLKKNQREPIDHTERFDCHLCASEAVEHFIHIVYGRPKEWYDFYARTDEVLVPSQWVSRLDEANAVNNQFEYLREKLDEDFPKETEKIDRETLYCSSALHKIRQNTFYKRLHDHQMRWQPIILVGELASSLPRPTTDPAEIEKQLYMSLLNKK